MLTRYLLCALLLPLASCNLVKQPVYQEQGLASYIPDSTIGRPTASGPAYQPYYYTAAHSSLPLGTGVTVTNLQTGQSANVVVNDRSPHSPGRVINLSSAAAQAIGIPRGQMSQVKVTARTFPSGQQQARNASSYHYNTSYRARHNAPAPPQPVQPKP